MNGQMAAALASPQKDIDTLDLLANASLFTVNESKAGALAEQCRKRAEEISAEMPPIGEAAAGHNPILFPIFQYRLPVSERRRIFNSAFHTGPRGRAPEHERLGDSTRRKYRPPPVYGRVHRSSLGRSGNGIC